MSYFIGNAPCITYFFLIELCFRIKENIKEKENGKIYNYEIERRLDGRYTNVEIGRAMKHQFRGLRGIDSRFKNLKILKSLNF